MESWHKGDFVQYTKLEVIPEDERRRKYGDISLAPFLRRTKEYLSDSPLILNGKVPVHTSCSNCDSWLEAYAKITNGKLDGIVEATLLEKRRNLSYFLERRRRSGKNSREGSLICKNHATMRNLGGQEWNARSAKAPHKTGCVRDARRYWKRRIRSLDKFIQHMLSKSNGTGLVTPSA